MTEGYWCPYGAAEQPYHLKSIDLKVYSLEEILYFYYHHQILLDRSLMQEDFVFWVREHLKQPVLAEKLHQLIAGGGSFVMFMETLVAQGNILDDVEKQAFLEYIVRMEDKNELERRKMLADQMMERGKFEAAILEYRRILKGKEQEAGQQELLAKVWHNLGCCYGKMLYYKEALNCFQNAYSYERLPQTKQAVAYIMNLRQAAEDIVPMKEDDSFVHLLSRSDQAKRDIRYQQLKLRMQEYLRSTL